MFRKHLIYFVLVMLMITPVSLAQDDDGLARDEVFADIYEQVSPSVVSISVVARRPGTGVMGEDQTVIGGGTGFVLDMDGHILTNNHVVEGATEIEVSFIDGTLAFAQPVGLDPDSDIAVIRVDLPAEDLARLQPVTFGDSDSLRIGQTVLAIGSPFGQRWTLTSGIVSATDRSIPSLTDFSIGGVVQTDAAINPGNSGGPLLNLDGHVVGVNSQIVSRTGASAGVGFAVPGNLAQRVAQQLIEQGFVDYSYLGIQGRDIYLPLIDTFGLPNDTQGVVVSEVVIGGPADRGGLESAVFNSETEANNLRDVPTSADIITAIEGHSLRSISGLIGYLAAETEPGQTVTLTVLRLDDGTVEELQLDVTLTPRP